MMRPTIYGCAFPYRGPKSRTDINNLLTSAKYDANLARDFVNFLVQRGEGLLSFYCIGETNDEIEESLQFYDTSIDEINLDKAIKKIDTMNNTALSLLFGG